MAHLENDDDAAVHSLVADLCADHEVTLVHLRPSAPSSAGPPPGMLMSDIGIMIHDDWYRACAEREQLDDARAAARSALLTRRGIHHRVETVTIHRTLFTRRTRRHLRRAIERIADRARADVIRVGPGASLTGVAVDPGRQSPPGTGVGTRHVPFGARPTGADAPSTPEGLPRDHRSTDDDRRLVDELWIDLGGSG